VIIWNPGGVFTATGEGIRSLASALDRLRCDPVDIHVTFRVGLGHECGVRKGTMYPLRGVAID
jgi:hypothetical protein